MKKLTFTEADFEFDITTKAHKIAQAKHDAWLKELLEGAIVIYHDKELDDVWTTMRHGQDTHAALMIDVKEIEKKCEKHEPEFTDQSYKLPDIVRCKHCGVELVAKWSPNWTAK